MTSTAIILGFRLPPGADEADVRQLAVGSLQPTLALLDAHPEVRVGLVLSGEALRSLDAYDSSLVDGIRARVEAGRVEAMATALYEPLFGDIPEDDAVAQVQSHLALVRQRLNVRPSGLALPWMVWSESVARIARRCELEWVFVPGVQGVVSLEHEGASVRGLGCEALSLGSARNGRGASVVDVSALGELGQSSEAEAWLAGLLRGTESVLPSEAIARGLPAPRVVRPGQRPGAHYRQHWGASDLLHQHMVASSQLVGRLQRELDNPDGVATEPMMLVQAQRYLWRAQAGDVFVEGAEGGIRSSRQRHRAWRDVLRADRVALEGLRAARRPAAIAVDLDGDGVDEVLLRSAEASVRVVPARRGSLASVALSDPAIQLMGLPRRTRAEWEASLRSDPTDAPSPGATGEYAARQVIADAKRTRELYDALREDVDSRVSFEERFLHASANLDRFESAGIESTTTGLDGPWRVESMERVGATARCKLSAEGVYHDGDESWPIAVSKRYSLRGSSLELRYEAQNLGHGVLRTRVLLPLDLSLGADAEALQVVVGETAHGVDTLGDHAEAEGLTIRGSRGEVSISTDTRLRLWHYPVRTVHRQRGELVATTQGVCLGFVWLLQLWARESAALQIRATFSKRED